MTFADVMTPPYEKRIAGLAKELLTKTGVSLLSSPCRILEALIPRNTPVAFARLGA